MGVSRVAAIAVVAAGVMVAGAVPALANPNPPPDPVLSGGERPGNVYVAKGGRAIVTFTPEVQEKLVRNGITVKMIAPWKNISGKPTTAGIHMPVGERFDSFERDGRISYPGGFVFTGKGPDGKVHTLSTNGTSLSLLPVFAGFYFAPWLDDRQPLGKDVRLVSASFFGALVPGGFFAWHPEDNAWGPTDVTLRTTKPLAELARNIGLDLTEHEPFAKITVRWSDRQEWEDLTRELAAQ